MPMQQQQQQQQQPQQQQPQQQQQQPNIDDMVNNIHTLRNQGATALPSRDIPRDTTILTQDPQIQVNYIPGGTTSQHNYIDADENDYLTSKINIPTTIESSRLEDIYDELQMPILLAILFFLFQLPIFKHLQYQIAGSLLFFQDGTLNMNGLLANSILFATLFYFIQKIYIFVGKW